MTSSGLHCSLRGWLESVGPRNLPIMSGVPSLMQFLMRALTSPRPFLMSSHSLCSARSHHTRPHHNAPRPRDHARVIGMGKGSHTERAHPCFAKARRLTVGSVVMVRSVPTGNGRHHFVEVAFHEVRRVLWQKKNAQLFGSGRARARPDNKATGSRCQEQRRGATTTTATAEGV